MERLSREWGPGGSTWAKKKGYEKFDIGEPDRRSRTFSLLFNAACQKTGFLGVWFGKSQQAAGEITYQDVQPVLKPTRRRVSEDQARWFQVMGAMGREGGPCSHQLSIASWVIWAGRVSCTAALCLVQHRRGAANWGHRFVPTAALSHWTATRRVMRENSLYLHPLYRSLSRGDERSEGQECTRLIK